jgi:hypothetical protein
VFQLGSSIVPMIAFENVAYLIQPAVIVLYSALAVEYYIRYHKRSPVGGRNKENGVPTSRRVYRETNADDLYSGLHHDASIYPVSSFHALSLHTVSVTCTDSRAIYRTIELSEGWNGRIISNELYFSMSHIFLLCLLSLATADGQPGRRSAHLFFHLLCSLYIFDPASVSSKKSVGGEFSNNFPAAVYHAEIYPPRTQTTAPVSRF